jgi:bile acid-coenzyme A ligase
MTGDGLISFPARLAQLAAERPTATAVVFIDQQGSEDHLSWTELDTLSNQVAWYLADQGVGHGDVVALAAPASRWQTATAYGAWKRGASCLPLSWKLPAQELAAMLASLDRPPFLVGSHLGGPASLPAGARPAQVSIEQLSDEAGGRPTEGHPDVIAPRAILFGSGGSTGRPKIVNSYGPAAKVPGQTLPIGAQMGQSPDQRVLITSPMYHAIGFSSLVLSLFEGRFVVAMEHFDASEVLRLVERFRITNLSLVPTMMQRLIRHPDVGSSDLTSVATLLHAAAPCAPWLKRAWIDRLGADRVVELYTASEQHGYTLITGDEWLSHPGSVGRPVASELRILDPEGRELPAGEVGEIFMKVAGSAGPIYEYLGAQPMRTTDDGLTSVGDLGWVDADGYLYIADRRTDLILSGGANIYPAEVEAALGELPDVGDCVVVGVPHHEWGRAVHAIVEPADPDNPPAVGDLDRHCRSRLAAYKVPRSYEFVARLPRNEAGKIRRSALAAERAGHQDGPGSPGVPIGTPPSPELVHAHEEEQRGG